MNDKTEAAPSTGPEEAVDWPAPSGRPARRAWRAEELRGADLRGQDLRGVDGLLPEHLAGAVLTGATLPDDIGKFEALGQVAAISSEARKVFIGLLAACVYSWLVIGTTKDVALILNTSSSPLPIINAPIPITGFYVVGATLLAAIYCYFHFYLQPMWRALATLPAVFRDGVTQDDKTDPWVLTNLVRTEFAQLRATAPPLTRLENRLSIVMAWWLVPVTLVALWARYLPAHDLSGLTWLAFLIGATTFFGRYTFGLARAKLRGEEPPAGSAPPGDPPQTLLSRVLRELSRVRSGQIVIWFLLPFLIIVALSISASVQSPRDSQGSVAVFSLNEQVLREFDPTPAKLLNFVRVRTYADLREAEVAQMPPDWAGKDWGEVKRVELRARNLAFADVTSAFLANADLRGATMTGAQLGFAQLQGADLRAAQLQGAVLWQAQLQGALLAEARLQGARLQGANLQGANLGSAELWSAALSRANLQGADLRGAQLQGADLSHAQLQGANLDQAQLQGAQLGSANLQGASLQGANLQGADLRDAQLHGANLYQAELQGADLRQAQLQGADLRGTRIWRTRGSDALWDVADLRASTVLADDRLRNRRPDQRGHEGHRRRGWAEGKDRHADRDVAGREFAGARSSGAMAIRAERDVRGRRSAARAVRVGASPSGPRSGLTTRTSRPSSVISLVAATWPKRRPGASPGAHSNLRGHRRARLTACGPGCSPRASSAPTARRPKGCPATCAAGSKSLQHEVTRRPLHHRPPRPIPASEPPCPRPSRPAWWCRGRSSSRSQSPGRTCA